MHSWGRTRTLVALCCAILCTSGVALAAKTKAPKPPSAVLATLAWQGASSQIEANFWLAGQLLSHEAASDFSKPNVQLRIQWNAASLQRLAKAYQFYIAGLHKHYPKHSKHWKAMSAWNKKIQAVAKLIRMDALNGTKGKAWLADLKALRKGFSNTLPKQAPKRALKPPHFAFLLETISGLGTGTEILSYYRLFQIVPALKKSKKINGNSLKPLGALISYTRASKSLFKGLRKQMKSASWASLYAYHAALLSRCGLLFGKSLRAKGAKREKLKALLKKRTTQLRSSLKKANKSFQKFWRL